MVIYKCIMDLLTGMDQWFKGEGRGGRSLIFLLLLLSRLLRSTGQQIQVRWVGMV